MNAKTTVKVAISFTVEIDREAWEANYGGCETAAEFRTDVKRYVEDTVWNQLQSVEVLGS